MKVFKIRSKRETLEEVENHLLSLDRFDKLSFTFSFDRDEAIDLKIENVEDDRVKYVTLPAVDDSLEVSDQIEDLIVDLSLKLRLSEMMYNHLF